MLFPFICFYFNRFFTMAIKIENSRLKPEVTIDTGTAITVESDATVIRSIRSCWKFHRKQIV